MSKIKNACMKIGSAIKSGWQETNKVRVVRLLAFCIGFIFNILGIIGVAVWKYIFCNDDKKYKYCIRLSIFGMLTEIILCTKCLFVSSAPMYDFAFGGNDFMKSANRIMERNMRDFDRDFARIERQMVKDRKQLERQIEKAMKENNNISTNKDGIKTAGVICENGNCKDIKPEVKRTRSEKNGWVNETITETTPNSYMHIETSSYDSRRDKRVNSGKLNGDKKIDKNVKNKTEKKDKKSRKEGNKKDSKKNSK